MFRKILHIITAGLILVSITGFTINAHYCHEQLIDLAFFAPAQSCCDALDDDTCGNDSALSHMSHCKNESLLVGATDDYLGTSLTYSFENDYSIDLLLSAILVYNFQGSDDFRVTEAPWHKEPPPYNEVVLSQIQSFLI